MVLLTLHRSMACGVVWLSLLGSACSTSHRTERLPTGNNEGGETEGTGGADDESDSDDSTQSLGGANDREVPPGTTLPRPQRAPEAPSEPTGPTLEELLAEPGWRNSSEPLCLEDFAGSVDLVLGEESVLVRYGLNCPPGTLDARFGYTTHVVENSGEGWEDVYGPDDERALYDLQVLEEETLLLRSDTCAATRMDSGSLGVCELEQSSQDLVSAGPGRTFALTEGSIWHRAGANWKEWAELPRRANRLFVSQELLGAMAPFAVFLQEGQGEVRALPSPPADTDYRDLWAFAPDDLWLSGDTALFHFDGSAWEAHEVEVGSNIRFLGVEGQLYFQGYSSFGRIENGQPREIFAIDRDSSDFNRVHAVAGFSPQEIFIAVGVGSDSACSRLALFFFDGEQLHAF